MNCYWCGHKELIVGGDVDIDEGMIGYPDFSVLTNASCPVCKTEVEIWKRKDAFD